MGQISKHLDEKQISGIQKMGDCLIPGDGTFPRFSDSGCARHVDRILDYMPESDLADLKILLGLFSYLPTFVVRLILGFLEFSPGLPGASLLRFMRLGIRGLVMTLYYGDHKILALLEYDVNVYTEDLRNPTEARL